jgi:entericidin B
LFSKHVFVRKPLLASKDAGFSVSSGNIFRSIFVDLPLFQIWSGTMKTQFTLIAIAAVALSLSGCANTIRGVGADTANAVNATQSAGQNVAQAAETPAPAHKPARKYRHK